MTNAETPTPSDNRLPDEAPQPATETREPFVAPELVCHEPLPTVTGGSVFFPPAP
ncbi:hypothetical protein [Rubrivirga sp.]|uniref:hypothetical protein n=1 Tax=Rubrivirga sp. TaxID=1885344 RepID=UPI003B52BE88